MSHNQAMRDQRVMCARPNVVGRIEGENTVEMQRLKDENERLAEALWQISQWADAYPVEVFLEPTEADWAHADRVLEAAGLSLSRMSASNMRHVVKGVGEIARAALRPRAPDVEGVRV